MVSKSQDPTNEEMESDEDESSALPERGSSGENEDRTKAAATFGADYGMAAEGAASSSSGQHWTPSIPQPMAASPAVKLSSSAHRKVQLSPREEKRKLRVLKEEEQYEESDPEEQDAGKNDQPSISSPVGSTVDSPEMEPQGPVVVTPWLGQANMPETPRPPPRSKQSKSFPPLRMTPEQLAEYRERQELDDPQRYEDRRRTSQAKAWERSAWWSWHSWAGWQSGQSWEDWQERQQ